DRLHLGIERVYAGCHQTLVQVLKYLIPFEHDGLQANDFGPTFAFDQVNMGGSKRLQSGDSIMRWRLAIGVTAIAAGMACVGALPAWAQSVNGLPCDAFMKDADGSWVALRDAPISGAASKLTIRAGSVLRPGAAIQGLDLAAMLDQACPATPAAAAEQGPAG